MKQHSRDCIKCWGRDNHQSSLNHLDVNIQKMFIMFWVKKFQEMVNLIIFNWFNWSGVWIWIWFRVKFNWKLWRVNLKITIFNNIIINYSHDTLNPNTGFGRRVPVLEVILCRLAVPLSWCTSWFFTMKCLELIHISFNNWWWGFRASNDADISLVSNPST